MIRLTLRGWLVLIGGALLTLSAALVSKPDLIWPGVFLALLPLISLLAMLPVHRKLNVLRVLPATVIPAWVETHWQVKTQAPGWNFGGISEYTEDVAPALGNGWIASFDSRARSEKYDFAVSITPRWRGRHRIGPATFKTTHPFGMACSTQRILHEDVLIVTPYISPLENLRGLSAGSAGANSPVPRSGALGVDDSLLREYRDGDDPRRIHWPTSARLGELMVRREEHAIDPVAVILLDNRASSYSQTVLDTRFETAVSLAASIGVHLTNNKYTLTLISADAQLSTWDTSADSLGMLLLLTDISRNETTTLPQIPLPGDALFIAILGELDIDAALSLQDSAKDQPHRWCILLAGENIAPDAKQLLQNNGWRCLEVSPDALGSEIWKQLGDM